MRNSLTKNKNFYRVNISSRKLENLVNYDFILKSSYLPILARIGNTEKNSGVLLSSSIFFKDLEFNLAFRSQDITNFNDINFSKIYFFLNRLFFGIFDKQTFFKFKKPKVPQYGKSNRRRQSANVRKSNAPYNFTRALTFMDMRNFVGYLIYFLRLFAKQKQISVRTGFVPGKMALNFSVLDLTPLAAGSAAFYLFYDYFDWNMAQLLGQIKIKSKINREINLNSFDLNKKYNSQLNFYYFLSFFRFGAFKVSNAF